MALQDCGPITFPQTPTAYAGAPSPASFTLDALNESLAIVFRAPATKLIDKIHFRTGTTSTGGTAVARVETVTTSTGEPSGTLHTVNASVNITVNASDDNVWKSGTLTAQASVTKGELLALVILNGDGGNFTVAGHQDDAAGGHFPYGIHFTSVWTKSTGTVPLIIIEYSDGTFEPVPGLSAVYGTITSQAFNSSSTPDEHGIRFKVPFKCRVTGCWLWITASGDFDVKLYDSDGSTVLANGGSGSSVVVTDASAMRASAVAGMQWYPFKSEAELLPATYYRLMLLPTTTTNMTAHIMNVPNLGYLDMMSGGRDVHMSHRTNGGAWTDVTDERVFMGVIIDQLDDAAGGGPVGRNVVVQGIGTY